MLNTLNTHVQYVEYRISLLLFFSAVLTYFSNTISQPILKMTRIICQLQRFFSIPQDVSVMPPCVTSAMSVGNLNQVRDGNDTSTISQSNNNNNSINSSNNNNNNRVSNAVSAGNVSKIHTAKVTGELNARFYNAFPACVGEMSTFRCAIIDVQLFFVNVESICFKRFPLTFRGSFL